MIIPLSRALKNIIDRNLVGQLKTYNGCFNIRNKVGGTSKSLHSWGVALDINAATNGFNKRPTMSLELVRCFTDAGFDWGGRWSKPDGMHFQLRSLPNTSITSNNVNNTADNVAEESSNTNKSSGTPDSSGSNDKINLPISNGPRINDPYRDIRQSNKTIDNKSGDTGLIDGVGKLSNNIPPPTVNVAPPDISKVADIINKVGETTAGKTDTTNELMRELITAVKLLSSDKSNGAGNSPQTTPTKPSNSPSPNSNYFGGDPIQPVVSVKRK
jgi:hypothetical protein